MGSWLAHIPKSIGLPVADRTQPKEAATAQQKLQLGQTTRSDRCEAPPGRLSSAERRLCAQYERAYARGDAIGTDNGDE